MSFNWQQKALHNIASIKFWTFLVATGLLIGGIISEYTWAGIAGGLMGVARIFEYFTVNKNGNGGQ